MDVNFKITRSASPSVWGFAEVVGTRDGDWDVQDVYVLQFSGYRMADPEVANTIKLALHMISSVIGRAYRRSFEP